MKFDNSWTNELGGTYISLNPIPLFSGRLLYHSRSLAEDLELENSYFSGELSKIWSGDRIITGMQPLAQVYSGHQFGQWAGQLAACCWANNV